MGSQSTRRCFMHEGDSREPGGEESSRLCWGSPAGSAQGEGADRNWRCPWGQPVTASLAEGRAAAGRLVTLRVVLHTFTEASPALGERSSVLPSTSPLPMPTEQLVQDCHGTPESFGTQFCWPPSHLQVTCTFWRPSE